MNDITALAQRMKGQTVKAPYYLAECMNCGEMMPSSKLVESKNYPDGDADCYCPHCNADDCDIADLGNGEEPGVSAWNFQQKRIDALVEALEDAQQDSDGVAGMAEHYETTISMLKVRIAELESRTVTVKSLTPEVCNALKAEGLADVLRDAAEYAPLTAGQWVTLTKNWHQTFIGLSGDAAGIQVIEGEGQ